MFVNSTRNIFKLLFLSSFLSTANANDIKQENTYIDAYAQFSGQEVKSLEKFTNEENFKIASSFIFNPDKQESRRVNSTDVHDTSGKVDFKDIKIPNYTEALKFYIKSAEENSNPISAYAGSYILKNFTSMQDEKNIKNYKMFTEVLFKQENKICQAYLQQGEVYENGYLQNKDEKKALVIYKEGLANKNCNSPWMISVLNSKIIKLEK